MTRYIPIILLAAVLLALGLFALVRCNTPPVVVTVTPVVVTVTPSATATSTPKPSISPSATIAPPTATVTPELPTETPTAVILTATPTPQPTPDLLGTHRVRRGQTMWGIALEWYPRRWFLWAEHAWKPICAANPQIVNCRMLYVGDVLAIPRLR